MVVGVCIYQARGHPLLYFQASDTGRKIYEATTNTSKQAIENHVKRTRKHQQALESFANNTQFVERSASITNAPKATITPCRTTIQPSKIHLKPERTEFRNH